MKKSEAGTSILRLIKIASNVYVCAGVCDGTTVSKVYNAVISEQYLMYSNK